MIYDTSVVNTIYSACLIKVRMSVTIGLFSVSCISRVSDSNSRYSSLSEDFLNYSPNTIQVVRLFMSIFNQFTLFHIWPEPKDTCTIVPTILV